MTPEKDRTLALLESFLKMPEGERAAFLISLNAEQLQLLISIFSSGLTEKIAKMAKKPETARARKVIAKIELYEEATE
ncbi:MAG TPA: hypothetical protein VF648_09770 [Pyrinomonadaceae bacterium]|jgi:hypothetical protein